MIHVTGSFEYRKQEAVYVACEDGRVYLAYLSGGVVGKYIKNPVARLNTFGEAMEYADVAAKDARSAKNVAI